jgi:hypothetical protein
LSWDPDDIGRCLALSTALIVAKAHCGDEFPTWEAWVTAMQPGSALFAAATTSEESVECRIHHEVRIVPALRGRRWLDHCLLAGCRLP